MTYPFDPLAPSRSEAAARNDAEVGSRALLNHLKRTKQIEPDRPQIIRTFEQQVELVEQGRAHCVEWRVRMPDPDMTLGGVVGPL